MTLRTLLLTAGILGVGIYFYIHRARQGQVVSVRSFNRALSLEEIQQEMTHPGTEEWRER